jgi:hypothetical protein
MNLAFSTWFTDVVTHTKLPVYTDADGNLVEMTPEEILGYQREPHIASSTVLGGSVDTLMEGGAPSLPSSPSRLVSSLPRSAPGKAALAKKAPAKKA